MTSKEELDDKIRKLIDDGEVLNFLMNLRHENFVKGFAVGFVASLVAMFMGVMLF